LALLVGVPIRALREESSISLDDLDAAGIKPGALDDLENGRVDPPFDVLLRVARALGVTTGVIALRAQRSGGIVRRRASMARL
jgi:transcriptional regulator with XRE-family HTH domain